MDTKEKTRENRLRKKLKNQGYTLQKSRARNWSDDNYLGYRIIYAHLNSIEAGEKYDLSLDDVERFACK